MQENIKNIKYAFWGTGPLAESVLYALYKNDLSPALVITKPDSRVGRHQELSSPYIKSWCESKNIKVYQPEKLKDNNEILDMLKEVDLCIVASYGKIIPENILNTPKLGFLNVHPSMLPLYRGPSPIESQLATGAKEIGISIMKLDSEMDHGPILIQSKISININDNSHTTEIKSGQAGGELLVQIFEAYISGNLKAVQQEHDKATFCKFIKKEDGEIKIDFNNKESLGQINIEEIKNKFRAYTPWPGIYFLHTHKEKTIRVKISEVNLDTENIETLIQKIIPEGKSEMTFESFKNGYILN